MATITQTVTTLVAEVCSKCGVSFAMTDHFMGARRQDHVSFYCPNGHRQYYPQETDAERFKRELRQKKDQLARERSWHDQTKASLTATKGVATRRKKQLDRVQKGVCPECNRHFVNVERHMANKHG